MTSDLQSKFGAKYGAFTYGKKFNGPQAPWRWIFQLYPTKE